MGVANLSVLPSTVLAAAGTLLQSGGETTIQSYTASQLETMLQSSDPKERADAIVILRHAGASAVPVFIWALDDEDRGVRIAAVKSFDTLGAAAEPAAVPLANLLAVDPIPAVQTQIIHTLGQMGPYAAGAIPTLRRLQREATLAIRVHASKALNRILDSQPRP
jgi:hypothetical protein